MVKSPSEAYANTTVLDKHSGDAFLAAYEVRSGSPIQGGTNLDVLYDDKNVDRKVEALPRAIA